MFMFLGVVLLSVTPIKGDIAEWLSPVGCFRDKNWNRALPNLLHNFRGSGRLWKSDLDFSALINECGATALSKGFTIFGIEFYGECWTTKRPDDHSLHDKHKSSKNCEFGVGKQNALMVYSIDKSIGKCGVDQRTNKIIGGKISTPGKWPWQVSLYFNGSYSCGGSIIDPYWILTAGHCINKPYKVAGKLAEYYQAHVGDFDRRTLDVEESIHQADVVIYNAAFQYPQPDGDIGLIHLQSPIIYNHFVKPVCLPEAKQERPLGKTCYVTGWGVTRFNSSPSRFLREAFMPTVTMQECSKKTENSTDPWLSEANLTENMLCGGIEGSELSGCYGDSGGPYVCLNAAGHWEQHGIVSWGSRFCDSEESFSVFTRVSMFTDWINSKIKDQP